jgi:uncharacterized protein (TIGR02118 family)
MVKVSVMYPNGSGVRFDHDYYREKHMPLIERRMHAALKYYTIDRGLRGAQPNVPATYVGMCHLLCDSLEAYHTGVRSARPRDSGGHPQLYQPDASDSNQ